MSFLFLTPRCVELASSPLESHECFSLPRSFTPQFLELARPRLESLLRFS